MWNKYKSNNSILELILMFIPFCFRVYNNYARPGSPLLYYLRKIISADTISDKTASENLDWDSRMDLGTSQQADSHIQMFWSFFSLLTVLQNDCNESRPRLRLATEIMWGLAVFALHHHPKIQPSFLTSSPCPESSLEKHCEDGVCFHYRPAKCFMCIKKLRIFLVLWT